LITAVVEDFYTQQMANTNPLDAWAQAVEIGLVTAVARFLASRWPRGKRAPVPQQQLEAIKRLIPENLRSLIPRRMLFASGGRAKALREMIGPPRVERQKGGLLEAAWIQALRSWSGTCCPPDVTGGLAILHPPPAGNSKWPGLLLALCLACESRDRELLRQVEQGIQCVGRGCPVLMKLQIMEQHAWNVWKDPAAKRWLPLLQLVLERFRRPRLAKSASRGERLHVLGTGETLAFLKAGGSMARFGDGEFWSMDRGFITPVVRSRFLQESLVYVARLGTSGCPGFKPAMVDVLGLEETFPDRMNYNWWRDRPFFRQIPFRYFPPGIYGNMWTNYRPAGSSRHTTIRRNFVEGWEEVFANKSVLLVGHPFAQAATQGKATGVMFGAPKADYDFPVRVAQVSWEMMRQVAQDRLAPFTRARDVRLMRPLAIGLASSVRWHLALQTVREVVDNSDIDVVAVSWGPQAKPLVADVACRGTQAIDVGRLLWELHGNSAMSGETI
ncbi:Ankyrin repeat domain-containing protein 17, partial [Durusdinium trenchii]